MEYLSTMSQFLLFSLLLPLWLPERAGLIWNRNRRDARSFPCSCKPMGSLLVQFKWTLERRGRWKVIFLFSFTFKSLIEIGNFSEFRIFTFLNVENLPMFQKAIILHVISTYGSSRVALLSFKMYIFFTNINQVTTEPFVRDVYYFKDFMFQIKLRNYF